MLNFTREKNPSFHTTSADRNKLVWCANPWTWELELDLWKINYKYPERLKILNSFKQNSLKVFVDKRVFRRITLLNHSVKSDAVVSGIHRG